MVGPNLSLYHLSARGAVSGSCVLAIIFPPLCGFPNLPTPPFLLSAALSNLSPYPLNLFSGPSPHPNCRRCFNSSTNCHTSHTAAAACKSKCAQRERESGLSLSLTANPDHCKLQTLTRAHFSPPTTRHVSPNPNLASRDMQLIL
jgi:hypothetical protein